MQHWDEIRTAYFVVREGTVSGAASALGVHHATVIRHIDALEERLGVKLFQRHARGYTPTEAGADLARVAQTTDDQFSQLGGRLRGQGDSVSGDLVVTALPSFAERVTPVLVQFQRDHPEVRVRLLTGARVFRLEYGEAHLAIRAGSAPEEPDNVVQPYFTMEMGLFAAPCYVERFGLPTIETFDQHRFVGFSDIRSRAPFMQWQEKHVPPSTVRYRATDDRSLAAAVRAGAGVGFMAVNTAGGLIEVMDRRPEWNAQTWLVTHVDLHRSAKVQAALSAFKAAAKEWAREEEGISLP
ncbi:HTH-type transcriptional regulator PerR [Aliiroseovarius sp. xm-m-379]|uniref:LysR family transcriptional regulator n=1 Tax=unclassified Aliiroseovarius TaxID=2623558 RepID=UPI001569A0D1|nr:HTH-type transcriptional regulator PerR [Aliiroseovarius sp. xm-d-517]NRP23692.1 HTH-type transcriptional regulator PerR [Aliiroseovarius sp. xm-m-379]NRP29061.1 HTH-type transcriptional regulator PerR [Aliiroseovarius sp. xm-m-314]NRP32491.1 HTH-type transcriptional regulator PerR [Aliiroseovarius sp. xm-a-104]NRP41024.1 HTH-type transcriptional regulator PerR [Aliiroseovarius sp. xm-m-339-2]NRP43786.1 HTH-type transcriptional regulator PerR [Aliiroseovarius sp. xm-m-378]NRP48912.1 HTH-ty